MIDNLRNIVIINYGNNSIELIFYNFENIPI